MNLKCKINSKEYPIVQGATFSEEYNETLDSGTIIISQVNKIEDLQPFDDVYIWDADEKFDGYTCPTKNVGEPYVKVESSLSSGSYTFKNIVSISTSIDDIFDNEITKSDIKAVVTYFKNDEKKSTNVVFECNRNDGNYYLSSFYTDEDRVSISLKFSKVGDVYQSTFESNEIINIDFKSFKFEYNLGLTTMPNFFKHFLIDQFSEEVINLNDGIYKYQIELFSETKGLEVIQLPNISITQPLNIELKKSVYDYLVDFVDMYSPLIKVAQDKEKKIWAFNKKYSVSTDLKEIFDNVYSPDFSLNNPNLRDVLSQLMLTKDMIPYVYNNVIYGLDISKRKGDFNFDTSCVNYINSSRSSDNHCDNLKRSYSNALSQDNSARMVEYLGFRNSDTALLTIDNMRLETRYPIYKINKIYMCYYKKIIVTSGYGEKQKMFLCKQDITSLVKLDSERNLLSQDWQDFGDEMPTSIEDLSKYKLCTVGYSIGSNYIEGWGTKYEYPNGWFDIKATYIENIAKVVDNINPYGIYQYGYITRLGNLKADEVIYTTGDFSSKMISPFSNDSLNMKAFFFIVDYQAFYNGTVIHSKDLGRDDITINDNSSSSLTLLEQDGLFEKEKVNRFGNKAMTINARYKDISQLQELGSIYNSKDENDVIIYHREYSIYDNCINAIYYGTKSYVLRNYFTSVYAKHRTYNLMSYGESINRAENKKMMILLSKDNSHYERENIKISFNGFLEDRPISTIMSFLKESPKAITIDYFDYVDKINYGYILYDNKKYATDINAFVSGTSLCFNMIMYDNVSAGVYIKTPEPNINKTILQPTDDDYTGSVQDWNMIIDSEKTGFAEKMGFYMCHLNKDLKDIYYDSVYDYDLSKVKESYDKLFKLPLVTDEIEQSNIIGMEYDVHKDNKERIDMTFQIEPVTDSEDIMFSQWIMKLSDLLSLYQKNEKDYTAKDTQQYTMSTTMISTTFTCYKESLDPLNPAIYFRHPLLILYLKESDVSKLTGDMIANATFPYPIDTRNIMESISSGDLIYYIFELKKIVSVSDDEVIIEGDEKLHISKSVLYYDTYINYNRRITLKKQNKIGKFTPPDGYYYYSNMEVYYESYSGLREPLSKVFKGNELYYEKGGKKTVIDMKKCSASNGKNFYGKEQLNMNNSNFETIYLSSKDVSKEKLYFKNMYVVESNSILKKSICYNEYKLSELKTSSLQVGEVFKVMEENGIDYINIDLSKVEFGKKSIQYWYLDTPKELIKYDDVSLTQKENNQRVTIELKNSVSIKSVYVDNKIFTKYTFNNDLLVVDLTSYSSAEHIIYVEYVQYRYEQQEGSLKFVFGVNLTIDDFIRGYVKINMSLLSTKDKRVYDNKHNLIGYINNYASENNKKIYGEEQYYCDII